MRKQVNVLSFISDNAIETGMEMAMSNGHSYHLAAFLKRGKGIIRIGVNSDISHARFLRIKDGTSMAFLHAEMDAVIAARPGDTLIVVRWNKSGKITMSRPCKHCQEFIADAGIKKVVYSGWNGKFFSERFA